jgi:hypothetical protein
MISDLHLTKLSYAVNMQEISNLNEDMKKLVEESVKNNDYIGKIYKEGMKCK